MDTLYDPSFEHDACGTGFVARINGRAEHQVLRLALEAVSSLEHRGALAADGKSGDGAGVLTQLPAVLFREELERLTGAGPDGDLGVAMLFAPPALEGRVRQCLERAVAAQGLRVLAWRDVPLDSGALGDAARRELPRVLQLFIAPEASGGDFEHDLYLARKTFERGSGHGYVCSMSSRTIVYKGLCVAHQLGRLYPDLADPRFQTAFAVFHQRYSTNTLPSWEMAQPFRFLAHNGEINTLSANRAWMRSRQAELPEALHPLLQPDGSDSAALDGALELLARNGRDLAHALAILVPPAWEDTGEQLPPEVREFFRSHAPILEPWDGPAAVAFADGRFVGAALDRNGLRPCRFQVTDDGLVVAGSEVGIVAMDQSRIVEKGRLGPGEMLLVDLEAGVLLRDEQIKHWLAKHHTAPRWAGVPLPDVDVEAATPAPLAVRLAFGFTREDQQLVLAPMAEDGAEALWSMGDDTPVAPLARAGTPLYACLRQRFAQVTNPPIDPLREKRVMTLRTWLGPRPSLFDEQDRTRLFELGSPLLRRDALAGLRAQGIVRLHPVDCTFEKPHGLEARIEAVCLEAEEAVSAGAGLLLLTDRGVDAYRAPIPMALAAGAVHQRLVARGLRARAGIIAEAGDCWDVHHVAMLLACGATVVHPWLALECAAEGRPDAEARVVAALEAGLRKVMSKMGISAVASYRGGQLFEVMGLADAVVARCFRGAPSRVGGRGFAELGAEVLARHEAAFAGDRAELADPGRVRFRRGGGAEHHAWAPEIVRLTQRAVGAARGQAGPDPSAWPLLDRLAADAEPAQLRDLLELAPDGPSIPVDRVEPAEAIARRFVVSAMSLGALSPEAHRALTIAMNRLGARSNSGEGGEDPDAYRCTGGDRLDNKVKQVASARFGVTAEYLARAEELEIKIAQGAKPGEGGQLPGHKVTELIARLRHATPGVTLISPPPHHDIYSIEDLAQLIHDLKEANPRAAVGVKLVSQAGVGTIAAGVAKAYAEYIVIAGHAGGTGASPLSSIKHAGAPWELGLAEAQQVLVRNGLRSRVRLRVDGGLATARDVVVAALLGAEEFGFGTAPLVALGCDMARQCHRNTCPAGIATQSPELRARFRGTPEAVIHFFLHLAEEARGLLARLGLRTLEDAVGRVDLLRQSAAPAGLDLAKLLAAPSGDSLRCRQPRNLRPRPESRLDGLLAPALGAVAAGRCFEVSAPIRNSDRTVGARLAGMLALRGEPLAPDAIRVRLTGSAGQSFGAFAVPGMTLELDGEANDYVGKGLSGGTLVLRPRGSARREPARQVILGNVALYGATGGRLFAAGRAGERFAVRNSGATAVVEGVGDHGCEYMTGGCVVVLGRTGWNFGAGMTGGAAYVLDEQGLFAPRVNRDTARCRRPTDVELRFVRCLVEEHVRRTGSRDAAELLRGWSVRAPGFWWVGPVPAEVETAAEPLQRAELIHRPVGP